MKTRKLGNITVSAIGMGCMGFTHAYGKTPEEREGIRLVHKAFEMGCTLFDTAEMYSYFGNEEFVGKALKGLPREKVIISDKFWPEKLLGHDFYVFCNAESDEVNVVYRRKNGTFGLIEPEFS